MPGGIGILKRAFISYRGVSDALGTALLIRCAALAGLPDFNNQSVVILDGPCKGQSRDINGITTGGVITAGTAFAAVIAAGVNFLILSLKPATAEVADIKTQIDKLAGVAPVEGSTTKNWNTAVDSPDGTGGLVVNIGVAATRYKLHSLLLDVSALTNGAIIRVKLFMDINSVQQKVYDQPFTVNTAPDGLWIVNGIVVIHDILSVAVYSDTNENVAIGYTAILEAM